MLKRSILLAGAGLLACVPAPSGDENDEAAETSAEGDCSLGTEACACFENQCFDDLVCVDQICVPGEDGSSESDSDSTTTDTTDDTSTTDATDDTSTTDSTDSTDATDSTDSSDSTDTTGGDGDGDCDTGTNAGCEFYAVRLALKDVQVLDDIPMLIAVTNPSEDVQAEVTIERRIAGNWVNVAGPTLVDPLTAMTEYVGNPETIVFWGVDEDGFRIRSTTPVVAHQFTSSGVGASTLWPTSSWGTNYYALGHGYGTIAGERASYVAVVASVDGTTVDVTLGPYGVRAGGGVPAGTGPGSNFQIELDAGEVLGLFTDGLSATINGTQVTSDSDHPIGVFMGFQGFEDHNEDQLLDVGHWGYEYAIPRVRLGYENPQSSEYRQRWRVMASEDATFVELSNNAFEPLPGPQLLLEQAADYVQITAQQGFIASAPKPIGLVNATVYQESQFCTSTAMLPSTDRLLDHYVIHVPDGPEWSGHRLTVAIPSAETISIDGVPAVPLDHYNHDIFNMPDGWQRRAYDLTPGVHVIDSDQPFMALVAGGALSRPYLYVAGMAL